MFRIIEAEDTGLLMQPNLPWLGGLPDGKVLDQSKVPSQGLLEIKCLYSKRDCDIHKLVRTDDLYIGLDKNKIPYLKKKHSLGYNNPNSNCNRPCKSRMVSLYCLCMQLPNYCESEF